MQIVLFPLIIVITVMLSSLGASYVAIASLFKLIDYLNHVLGSCKA